MRDIREEYEAKPFSEDELLPNPLDLAQHWFDDAVSAKVALPNAIVLATVSAAGIPSTRTVLLKGISHRGFEFFTHYQSAKAEDLATNKHCAFTLLWKGLNRQINVQGEVTRLSRADSEAYFASRPEGSQISAVVSPQSQVISRRELEEKWSEAEAAFAGKSIPCPESWGGYLVHAASVEFWQGRPNRLHDRFRFLKDGQGAWHSQRLAP